MVFNILDLLLKGSVCVKAASGTSVVLPLIKKKKSKQVPWETIVLKEIITLKRACAIDPLFWLPLYLFALSAACL